MAWPGRRFSVCPRMRARATAVLALALTAGLLIAEGPAPAYPLALAMAGWAFLRWRRFSADRARGPG